MMMTAVLLSVAMVQVPVAATQEEAVRLESAGVVLHGTLLLPAQTSGKAPVALIIAGSGPTDRNGNTPQMPGGNNSLKLLAESLATQGIASLRYDKRGVAASRTADMSEAELRFTHFSDDAAAWIAQLRRDARFSTITIIGHSEGSLVGMLAAQKERPNAFVSLAGAGRPIADVLTEQLEKNLPPDTKPEAMRVLSELRAGRKVEQTPPSLAALFRPSVQPYLMSWLPLDPAAELARLALPALIVQGSTDIQITVTDAERLARAEPRAELAVIDGMNHVLKEVREASQQVASYSDPALPLHPEVGRIVGAFVLTRR
jgi:pimeloyl-ACP methyl ester carboxylesterase